jgi:hypothetical protein
MGQQQTKQKNYVIPTGKNYKMSYCVQDNVQEIAEKKEIIDLSKLLEEYTLSGVIFQFIYYKLKHEGYVFKEYPIGQISYRLDQILDYISDRGIFLENNVIINDFKLIKSCYEPNLNNVYSILNKGNIILAGIILNESF